MAAISAGGGAMSMYTVQIESLQTYQKQLTTILQDLQNGQQSKLDNAGTGASVFGSFPEAASFSNAFENVRQQLIDSFGEITQLVEAMITALGTSASNYQAVEEQIADQFKAISSQYGYPVSAVPTSSSSPGSASSTSYSTGTSKSTPTDATTGTGPTYALSGSSGSTGTDTTSTSTSTDDGNASAGALG